MEALLTTTKPTARTSVTGHRMRLSAIIAVTCYCVLAMLAYWPASPFDSHVIPGAATGDPVQMIWYLRWLPFALLHGHNPFFTNFLDYPSGANLATNTLAPALGLAAAPLTLTLGPVATYNFLLRLALASSASSMYFVTRRWTRWTPAAFAGGLLYGFGSYMSDQGLWHLQLAFTPLPPLILGCLAELTAQRRAGTGRAGTGRSARRNGILLGLLCAAQFLIHAEVLADCLLIGAVGLLALAVTHRRQVQDRARHVLRGLGWAVACFLPLCAYPAWFLLAGPRHLDGPISPVWLISQEHADLLSPIRNNIVVHLLAQDGSPLTSHGVGLTFTNNTDYLGIPLLVLLALLTMYQRRATAIRLAVFLALVSYVLTLGPHLSVDGKNTGIPLPALLLARLPLADDIVWNRWSLFMMLFASVVLSIGLDRLHDDLRKIAAGGRIGRLRFATGGPHAAEWIPRTGVPVTLFAVATAALIPLTWTYPMPSVPTTWPGRLVSSLQRSVPQGGVVLALPYVTSSTDAPMAWQAIAQMRFRIVGGYATVPNPAGGGYFHVAPTKALTLLDLGVVGAGAGTLVTSAITRSSLAVQACEAVPEVLREFSADALVVWPSGSYQRLVSGFLKPALGRPSATFGQALVWYNVQRALARRARCGRETHLRAMAVRQGWMSYSSQCWTAPPDYSTISQTATVPGKGTVGMYTAARNRPYYTFAEIPFTEPQNWLHKKYIRITYKGTGSGLLYQVYFELSPTVTAKYTLTDNSSRWRTVSLPTAQRGIRASAWSHVLRAGLALGPKSETGTIAISCPLPS